MPGSGACLAEGPLRSGLLRGAEGKLRDGESPNRGDGLQQSGRARLRPSRVFRGRSGLAGASSSGEGGFTTPKFPSLPALDGKEGKRSSPDHVSEAEGTDPGRAWRWRGDRLILETAFGAVRIARR